MHLSLLFFSGLYSPSCSNLSWFLRFFNTGGTQRRSYVQTMWWNNLCSRSWPGNDERNPGAWSTIPRLLHSSRQERLRECYRGGGEGGGSLGVLLNQSIIYLTIKCSNEFYLSSSVIKPCYGKWRIFSSDYINHELILSTEQ